MARGPSSKNKDLIFLPPYIYYCFKNAGEGFDPEGRVIPPYEGETGETSIIEP